MRRVPADHDGPGRAGLVLRWDGLGDHPGLRLYRNPLCLRSRMPATTGAVSAVLMVVASRDRPLRRIYLSAFLVCP